ncbi:MAG: methylaspartate mutase subunit S [Synergistaceae bacterium]|jgi:methylaspartate mutase sigma subunit|nr:methylaspartate mutase subunit S [Synergistaceae bacterium]
MNKNIVIGVIGNDVHTIGKQLLSYAMRKEGYSVNDVGVSVSQDELINAAIETNASVIMIVSLYGHAELDCRGFRDKCIEAGIPGIKLYVGGNLVVGQQEWNDVEKRFLDMGFDRVAAPGTEISLALSWLKEDIG